MKVNHLLINLVNSALNEQGKQTARGNCAYHCPKCNHSKAKLEVNFDEASSHFGHFACWVCGFKSKNLITLLKKAKAHDKIAEAKKLLPTTKSYRPADDAPSITITLPEEFQSLVDPKLSLLGRHALAYLKRRGVSMEDIIKYNMGFCEKGEFANMVVIPSYDSEGNLNYFTARSFEKDPYRKYKNPSTSRDVIPFEMFINWSSPIVLCEGPFDAIAIKRNAIPMLGKSITPSLAKKLSQSAVDTIYVALDSDARTSALDICEMFMNEGKEVHFIEIDGKDPSELGFQNFTKLLHTSQPLTLSGLLTKRLL